MKQGVPIEIIDHQHEVVLSAAMIEALRSAASQVWPSLESHACPPHHLQDIDVLEIAFVSAEDSDRIHREFMDVPDATDVITFLHGELVICPQVAHQQAREHGEPLLRELLRYIIHGMLHLAGHRDDQEHLRTRMEAVQEELVEKSWQGPEFSGF
jgi:probable rRNA maturation factor